jgi:hypothetical protein
LLILITQCGNNRPVTFIADTITVSSWNVFDRPRSNVAADLRLRLDDKSFPFFGSNWLKLVILVDSCRAWDEDMFDT